MRTKANPGFLVAVASVAGAAAALAWAGPRPGELPHGSGELAALLAHGSIDEMAAVMAGLAAELCLLYLLLTALVVGAAQLPGFTGRLAAAVAGRIAPAFLRRAVEAGLGIAVATATVSVTAAPALATSADGSRPAASGTSTAPPADPGRRPPLPSLDRPVNPPIPEPTQPPPPDRPRTLAPSGVVTDRAVVVRRGDSLWRIAARRLGPGGTDAQIAAAWPRWFAANRAVVGPDPDLLLPGQRLSPPR